MSTPNPVPNAALKAAAPELITVLQAIQTFVSNMGTDPALWTLKFPGALTVLMGTASLQLPALAQAEAGVVQSKVNEQLSTWIAELQKAAA